jgi:glyoxylase-like metal-dependent hydrolase (beta-lactamase superfamily II)
MRPTQPAPGLLAKLIVKLFMGSRSTTIEATDIEYEVQDGDDLDIAGGIQAIHVPGHCAGQMAFLWPQHGGVLFAADVASNMFGLGWAIIYEDLAAGKRSLAKLAAMEFSVACFGHGKTILSNATAQFQNFVRKKGIV